MTFSTNQNIADMAHANNSEKNSSFCNYLDARINNTEENFNEDTINNINCNLYEIEELNTIIHNKSNQTYSAMHINIHSLPAKISQLEIMLTRLNKLNIHLDFILLCETYLNEHNQNVYNIAGYRLISHNRKANRGGGVAIFIKNSIIFKHRPDLEYHIENEFESIFIEAQIENNNIIVGEIYRIPNTSETESIKRFDIISSKLSNEKKDTIIGTDQNFDYIKIENQKNTLELLNNFLTAGLLPTITLCTRVTHTSATLIDNIYINYKSSLYK